MTFWEHVVDVSAVFAPWSSAVVFLSPLPAMLVPDPHTLTPKSAGGISLLPYSSMIASAFLWTVYGILAKEVELWTVNILGLVLGCYYFYHTLLQHHQAVFSGQSQPYALGTATHVKAVAVVVVLTVGLLVQGPVWQGEGEKGNSQQSSSASTNHSQQQDADWVRQHDEVAGLIGTGGAALTIAMFASPLVATVIALQKQQHSSSLASPTISFPFAFAALLNCILWTIYGKYRLEDFHVYFPMLIGMFCSLAQIAIGLHTVLLGREFYGRDRMGGSREGLHESLLEL